MTKLHDWTMQESPIEPMSVAATATPQPQLHWLNEHAALWKSREQLMEQASATLAKTWQELPAAKQKDGGEMVERHLSRILTTPIN